MTDLKLADLRRVFDESFAEPPRAIPDVEDFLTIRLCSDPYAIRVCDITGIATTRRLISLPSGAPALLGLIGIRGAVVPVFGLAALLGYDPPAEPGRWLALAGGEDLLALAFHELEAHVRLPRSSVYVEPDVSKSRRYVSEAYRVEGEVRPLISIPSVLTAIRGRPGRMLPEKEE